MANIKSDGEQLRELALFAGAGGGILGGKLLGWRSVCAVEGDAYAASVLVARQNDGSLPPFPIWDDVQTFDGRPWRGRVDVISGGFPCQDISVAGRGAGIDGEKSGMWRHMARITGEVAPDFVFVENSPALRTRGLDVVLTDLACLGYDARWGVIGADAAGFPHRRARFWLLAYTPRGATRLASERERRQNVAGRSANCRGDTQTRAESKTKEPARLVTGVGRVANGVACRVDRLKAIGNGQVPAVAALAWETLSQ